MTPHPLLDLIARRIVLLDGALGTELMRRVSAPVSCLELLNTERPEVVAAVHRDYFEAGSDVVATNTIGGNSLKLAAFGLEHRARELNLAAARLASSVRPAGRFVAGELGSTGKFLRPQGDHEETEFADAFAFQTEALAEGGADFILIETMFDLREALAAVRGARKAAPELPILASLTFNRTRRGFFTLMGDSLEKSVRAFEAEALPAFGANCTLTSPDMADLVGEMRSLTSAPIIAQANAGKPEIQGDAAVYTQSVDDFVKDVLVMAAKGARLIGGCCGTNPSHIRRMAEVLGLR